MIILIYFLNIISLFFSLSSIIMIICFIFYNIIDALASLTDWLTYQNSKIFPEVVETWNFAYS